MQTIDVKEHERLCRYRQAVESSVGIECDEHGYDVCPICDPCTCKDKPMRTKTLRVNEDEIANLRAGIAFYAGHFRGAMKGTQGESREHYMKQLRDLSRLCGKLGGRDWIAAGDAP